MIEPLNEKDQATAEKHRRKDSLMGFFDRPCLVDIDTQVDFVQPSGALFVPGADELIPVWEKLTEFGESHNLPMLASSDSHREDDPEFSEFPPHCVKGTEGHRKIEETLCKDHQVIENVAGDATIDFDNQLVLEKPALNLFESVRADEILGAIPCSTFAVYGVTTEYCIRLAVLGLLDRGYSVHVIFDAIKAIDADAGERALAEMANAGAAFITAQTFMDRVTQALGNSAG